MLRRTYGSVKEQLARIAGATGMNPDDDRVKEYTNLAIEELMNTFDMPSVIDRLRFEALYGRIVLPSDYDRMLLCNVDQVPMQMQSPWFEFVGYGLDPIQTFNYPTLPGNLNNTGWFNGVLDREQTVLFQEIPCGSTTWYLRVGGTQDERTAGIRPKILIQGYDANNNWIRTTDSLGVWRDGFEVEINGDTAPFFVQTTQSVKYITAIKKPITKGYVPMWVSDNASQLTYIAQYAPKDTEPFYREYFIPGLRQWAASVGYARNCVVAYCRKKFVPITVDNDWLLIPNLPALQSMVQAVYFREAKDPTNYANYKAAAVQILKDEAKGYIGLSRQKPLMTISEPPGMRQDGIYIL